MSIATEARPLPLNTILKVNGVSYRQEAVRRVVELDEVRIVHDQANPHDAHACEVRTMAGEILGFIPRDLAVRLSGPCPGGVWRARIEEVLRNDTWGLRVRVGPLVSVAGPDCGADVPGLRHRGDGTIQAPNGSVAVSSIEEAVVRAGVPPETRTVWARSGRMLGNLIAVTADKVQVHTPSGAKAAYPRAIVEIRT